MRRRVMLAAAAVALVVLAGWYAGLYRGEAAHVRALRSKEEAAQSALAMLGTRYSALLAQKRQLPAERADLAKLVREVPDGPALDQVEKDLQVAASRAGVRVEGVTSPVPDGFGAPATSGPATSGGSTGPQQMSITLSVTGTPKEIENLYQVLDASPRLFVIDNFAIPVGASHAPGAGLDTAEIDLRAFYASPDASSAAS